MSLLSVNAVSKIFASSPPVSALEDISLDVERGDVVAIVGPSGCGKSTLLRLVTGLDTPTSGSVEWTNVRSRPAALMPQRDALVDWLDVTGNIALAARAHGVRRRQARAWADQLLRDFGLEEFSGARPSSLSGGMRSRVAFLRTMLADADLLALDEPFGALDSLTRAQVQSWLAAAVRQRGLTVVLITHDIEEAVVLADTVVVMSARPGRIVARINVDLPEPRSQARSLQEFFLVCQSVREVLDEHGHQRSSVVSVGTVLRCNAAQRCGHS